MKYKKKLVLIGIMVLLFQVSSFASTQENLVDINYGTEIAKEEEAAK